MRGGFIALLAFVTACATSPKPAAKRVSAPRAVASASAAPSAAAPAAPRAARTIPELTFEPFRAEGKPLTGVFGIEGATIVTKDNVVGYIDGDRVEWIAKIPKDRASFAGVKNVISSVDGKFLDRIDLIVGSDFGRAPLEMWLPLTGKGAAPYNEPMGSGSLTEARIGDTVLLAVSSGAGDQIVSVRGPKLTRKPTNVAGCTKNSYYMQPHIPKDDFAAVGWSAFAGTAGTGVLVSVGSWCRDFDDARAEVWPSGSTTSKLVDLKPFWHHVAYPVLLRTGEDDLWAFNDATDPVLLFHNGQFEPIARLDAPVTQVFVSTKGELRARAGNDIHRWNGKAWELVARLVNPPDGFGGQLVMDASDGFWTATSIETSPPSSNPIAKSTFVSEVYRARETKRLPATDLPCDSWFSLITYGYAKDEAVRKRELAKLMQGYSKNDGLKLVTTRSLGYREHIGVSFSSKADAEAFAAHVKTELPSSTPAVWCYTPRTSTEIPWIEK